MKTIARNLLLTSVVALVASPFAIAQTNTAQPQTASPQATSPSNAWFEGWYRAKYGRPSPSEEARIKGEKASADHPEAALRHATTPTNDWYDGWYRAKFGRPSPLEEVR